MVPPQNPTSSPPPIGSADDDLAKLLRAPPEKTSPANIVTAIAVFLILAFSAHQLSRHYPITQALIQIGVYAFFVGISHRHPEVRTHGWAYILIGANLVTFGALIEISQYVWFLRSALTEENSQFRLFLRQVVGTNTGFLLFGYGFYRWLPTFIVSRNVMEQLVKRYQAELVRNEKLNSLAGLVSSVAHELNNPLSILVGYAGILKNAKDPELIARSVTEMERAAVRCKRVADNLLVFARKPTFERREVHVPLILDEALQLLEFQLNLASVQVERKYAAGLPPTIADRDQLLQVFFNLMHNALHALTAQKERRKLSLSVSVNAGNLVVEIADNGPGVPQEIQESIFVPFFTTKPVGVGTGLGLSICKGILKSHNGDIKLESEPFVRTAFICELPITKEQPLAEPAIQPGTVPDFEGKRFLVVDDEASLLDFCRIYLTSRKVTVDYCRSGEEALKRIQTQAVPYDLVLTDVRMPGLSGQEVYQKVQAVDPAMAARFIFMTGDTASSGTISFIQKSGRPCLLKPFTHGDLDRVVAQALGMGTAGVGAPVPTAAVKPEPRTPSSAAPAR